MSSINQISVGRECQPGFFLEPFKSRPKGNTFSSFTFQSEQDRLLHRSLGIFYSAWIEVLLYRICLKVQSQSLQVEAANSYRYFTLHNPIFPELVCSVHFTVLNSFQNTASGYPHPLGQMSKSLNLF